MADHPPEDYKLPPIGKAIVTAVLLALLVGAVWWVNELLEVWKLFQRLPDLHK